MNTNINKRKQIINFYTKLTHLLKGLFLLGLLGSLVSCGAAETTTPPLKSIRVVATLGNQTTTDVSFDSFERLGVTVSFIDIVGLTNERDQSPLSEGTLTLTEYSGENVVKEKSLTFEDPVGEDATNWESLAGFTDSGGVVYDVFIYFEAKQDFPTMADGIYGTATLGDQTTTAVVSSGLNDLGVTVYSIEARGLTNERDQSPLSEGSFTLTEYSGGSVINLRTLPFYDPVGEDATNWESLAGFTDSDGVVYDVFIYFEAIQPPPTMTDGIYGTATLGVQTTTAVVSSGLNDLGVTVYSIEARGLTNERDQIPLSEGTLMLTEYSGGSIVETKTLTFDDPVGEDAAAWESLAGFTDSDGVVYDVFIYFEARQPPPHND